MREIVAESSRLEAERRVFILNDPLAHKSTRHKAITKPARSLPPQTIPADVPATGGRSLALCWR